MSKIGQANLALTNDDMGEPPVFELIDDEKESAFEEELRYSEERKWELSKFTTEELWTELEKRGFEVKVPRPEGF